MAKDPRYHEEWSYISRHVRALFGYHCAKCNKNCSNTSHASDQLQVHHIDENPGNNELENLIPLCATCHLQIEKEARMHAPYHDQQLEIFPEDNYLKAMQSMRNDALERITHVGIQDSEGEMDLESYDLLEYESEQEEL